MTTQGRSEEQYGDAAIRLIGELLDGPARHAVALMRHSAREFAPGVHDLLNPLTPEGRDLALRLGAQLPKEAIVRGYASPPARCMDTAELVLAGHRAGGGAVTRHRPVEGLGVFYALDQMKMWKAMSAAGGLVPFVQDWVRGTAPADAMMPADVAANLVLRILAARLAEPVAAPQRPNAAAVESGETAPRGVFSATAPQVDVCVSHDMTLYLVREVLLQEPATGPEVRFLDALVLYEAQGDFWLTSQHGRPVNVTERLRQSW